MRTELVIAETLIIISLLLVGLTLGLNSRPEISSYMIIGGVLAYLITSIIIPKTRWIPLALTLGIHIGSIITYYSDPLVLPFIVIERHMGKQAINIDIIQILIAYEVIVTYTTWSRTREKPKTTEQSII
ncbi:MAG: hypothetical protein QXO93_01755 [Acidilobaceae archaeon]